MDEFGIYKDFKPCGEIPGWLIASTQIEEEGQTRFGVCIYNGKQGDEAQYGGVLVPQTDTMPTLEQAELTALPYLKDFANRRDPTRAKLQAELDELFKRGAEGDETLLEALMPRIDELMTQLGIPSYTDEEEAKLTNEIEHPNADELKNS